jgi:hypothetical protein
MVIPIRFGLFEVIYLLFKSYIEMSRFSRHLASQFCLYRIQCRDLLLVERGFE